jgi:RNA polymerase-binding transcription factor DksA
MVIELKIADNYTLIMEQDVVKVVEQQIEQIEKTLERMRNNSFGVCEVCGKNIPAEDILVDPLLTKCKDHQNT